MACENEFFASALRYNGVIRTYLKIAALADTALKTGSKCLFTGV